MTPRRLGPMLAAVGLVLALPLRSATAEPTSPPTLVARDLTGKEASLEGLRGRVTVVNFWATWCLPCRQEMPLLQGLADRHARRVEFVGVSVDEPAARSKVLDAVEQLGIRFPIWTGATVEDMQRFGVGVELPATVILDTDGLVVSRVAGVVDERDLTRRLDWLTSDRSTRRPWRPERPIEARPPRGAGSGGASLVPS